MKLARELEKLADQYVDPSNFPVKRDGSVLVAHYVVKPRDRHYIVLDHRSRVVVRVNLLVSAIAIASNLAKNHSVTKRAVELDRQLSKLYSDALFYEHFINSSKDRLESDVRVVRLEKSIQQAKEIRQQLNRMIRQSLSINTKNNHRDRKK